MRIFLILAFVLAPLLGGPQAAAQTFTSSIGPIAVETVARGLVHPWSLAFLPDGRMLVTERPGTMRIVGMDGVASLPISGLPRIVARGQAGLLDVALDAEYAKNRTIYFCYNADIGGTVEVARARLNTSAPPTLDQVSIIFRQIGPPSRGSNNVACRIAQGSDGNLFISLGEHFNPREQAQNLANHLGKIIRIAPDGTVPADNPFVRREGAQPEIWSFGHRNPEGLMFNPADGKLWEQEHGPQGGDEINIIEKGKNYGWPVIGFGVDYGGAPIHESTAKPGMEQPVWQWTPSIAPSGMLFYTGNLFKPWKGNLFNGALKYELLSRLTLEGNKVVNEEQLLIGLHERIRDVRQGPDGAIYLLTDNASGRILRLVPGK